MNQKTIINEADSLCKNAEDYLQDPSHVRSGIYTKVTGENNRIMRGTTNPVESGKFDLSDCNNHEFFNTVKKLVKKCNKGVLKQFYISVNPFGEITLYNFGFD